MELDSSSEKKSVASLLRLPIKEEYRVSIAVFSRYSEAL
jgi:hypothetical protein